VVPPAAPRIRSMTLTPAPSCASRMAVAGDPRRPTRKHRHGGKQEQLVTDSFTQPAQVWGICSPAICFHALGDRGGLTVDEELRRRLHLRVPPEVGEPSA
jgi:hypothetical protein